MVDFRRQMLHRFLGNVTPMNEPENRGAVTNSSDMGRRRAGRRRKAGSETSETLATLLLRGRGKNAAPSRDRVENACPLLSSKARFPLQLCCFPTWVADS